MFVWIETGYTHIGKAKFKFTATLESLYKLSNSLNDSHLMSDTEMKILKKLEIVSKF